ncbi:MAG TPA: MMPL family transporter [Thermomicrobiales bacterium]|nr:MMPL family transporter [Thermomicrobiales bacterium]
MFESLATFACRRPRGVVVAWLILIACVLPVLSHIDSPLKVGGFSASDSEGARAVAILQDELGFSPSQLAVIFTSDTLIADDPAFLRQVDAAVAPLRNLPYIDDVITPSLDETLIAPSKRLAYAVVGLSQPAEEAQREAREIEATIADQPDLHIVVAGGPSFYADVEFASQRDLQRAEIIAFPFALVALVFVFGSLVAAAVPLLVGSAGVAVTLLALYWLAHVADLSIFVLNLTTMLGLGLAIDYSLFVTSRFREELERRGGDVDSAVVTAMMTAGRAVFFSGMTVLVGLSGLTLFDIMFLRSVGIAGVLVVAISTLGALTLLPALLKLLGNRINALAVGPLARRDVGSHVSHGFWYRLAKRVERRPILVTLATVAILAMFGSPFLHANISSPDATMLPRDLPSRQGFDLLSSEFTGGEISPFVILLRSDADMRDPASLRELDALDRFLQNDPRVGHIQSALTMPGVSPSLPPAQRLQLRERAERLGVDTRLDKLLGQHAAMILAYPVEPANSEQNKELLRDLRAWTAGDGYSVLVAGGTAEIVDVVHDIYSSFPLVATAIVGTTYVILLLLFRSIILPLKAIVMNTMSILAAYGALVFIFQDGHFHRWLDFTPQGYVEASLPVIMFCILFGLSMDYEVFLLSRVQEEWHRTGDNDEAVAVGLERSGRIITSAALIVVVVTASFVSADVVIVKALGLCIALAVAIDATIVRALLVPATMKLLGHWNWWIPARLDRILPMVDFGEH